MFQKNIKWLLPVSIVSILAIHVFFLYYETGIGWDNALTDSISDTIILSFALWGTFLIVGSYPTRVGIVVYALIVGMFMGILSSYVEWYTLKIIEGRDDQIYMNWLFTSLPARYLFNCIICMWISTVVAISKRSFEFKQKFQQQTDASVLLKEAELYKLRQQLQPHFLYNSLNSISALTMIQPEKAQDMIGKLSEFLRSSVKRDTEERIMIDDELSYIQTYLSIESIRFGDRLKVEFIKDDSASGAMIPPFLLQPLLENAIKFGLYGITGTVTISMHIVQKDDILSIAIRNPYDSQTNMPKGTGFGIEGVKRRLYLLYARTDLLHTESDGHTFTAILTIPQHV